MSIGTAISDDYVTLLHGDCREALRTLPDESVDSCVTDPPYELGFMGKGWDASGIAYDANVWREVLRVLKPGGHLLAFGGTRTWHRLAVAIEDAGFDVRDSLAWMYGSGFPKSLDVSKAIDKAAGAERETVPASGGLHKNANMNDDGWSKIGNDSATMWSNNPATDAAREWQGWGTALKPAFEPIVVARKPLIGTVAENVLRYGTGALNIDGCRIGMSDEDRQVVDSRSGKGFGTGDTVGMNQGRAEGKFTSAPAGRWPANVILDESQAAELDRQSGVSVGQVGMTKSNNARNFGILGVSDLGGEVQTFNYGTKDFGGASRFFYTAKASTHERPRADGIAHPTVKPLDLMQYLVRLVTPPDGTVLEPFAGSGTTLEACVIEGFHSIGIELTPDYIPLIKQRLGKPIEQVLL